MNVAVKVFKILLLSLGVLLFKLPLKSQDFSRMSIPLNLNGKNLNDAWIGGLNCPQLSAIDLNNDGFDDLHIFDRVGNIQLTYLHSGVAGSSDYTYAPEYLSSFPEITEWMMLRDYNGDDIPDIFCYSQVAGIDGISVFTGKRDNGQLQFEAFQFDSPFGLASFPSSSGSLLQIFVSRIDYPGITDVDCDGDLDILTFNISGGYVEYYQNQSIEQGFGLDSLVFSLEDGCWGGFYESGITEVIDLAPTANDCFAPGVGEIAVNFRHTGSTLMPFDPDGDNDVDLVLGDLSFNNLNMLSNGGSCDNAWMNAQDIDFPNSEKPINLPTFPTSFFLDIDHDGQEDVLAAPNLPQSSEDQEVIWWYKGTPGDPMPSFDFQQDDFLVSEMLDLGTNAFPAFIDYNADGLMDIVVGNNSAYADGGQIQSSLYLFENVGTAQTPAFQLVDEDYLNMSQFNPVSYRFAPNFGDLDGDGDQDLLVGEVFGQLYYGENTAGPGQPIQIDNLLFGYMGIDVGLSSMPLIVDANNDGLSDLLVGERSGNVNYFENIGTSRQASFDPSSESGNNTAFFGNINTRAPGFLIGNSAPAILYENQQAKIVVGSEQGQLALYESDNLDIVSNLQLSTEMFGGSRRGSGTAIAFYDIDQNGFLDMLVGNERGGLEFFSTPLQSDLSTNVRKYEALAGVSLFPNPSRGKVQLSLPYSGQAFHLRVLSSDGRIVMEDHYREVNTEISTEHWPEGLYFVEVTNNRQRSVLKLVVQD